VAVPVDGAAPHSDREVRGIPPVLPKLISYTLRIGVVLAAALAIIGLVLLLSGPATAFAASVTTSAPFSLAAFFAGLRSGRATDFLFLAFLVLIATPLVRVIISVAMFASARDRPFTLLTLSVLILLAISVVIGGLV
jgi:uncharacterized membrane protein